MPGNESRRARHKLTPRRRCSIEYKGIIGMVLTTLSHWPRLKCWQIGKDDDLSLRAFLILTVSVGLWLAYGA